MYDIEYECRIAYVEEVKEQQRKQKLKLKAKAAAWIIALGVGIIAASYTGKHDENSDFNNSVNTETTMTNESSPVFDQVPVVEEGVKVR